MIWCDTNIAKCSWYFGLVTTEAMLHKEMRKMKVPVSMWPRFKQNERSNACTHFFDNVGLSKEAALVCMAEDKERSGIQIAALLVHEAVHIWQHHRRSIGEDNPSAEYEAYGIQSISQSLMGAYQEQTACYKS